MLKPIDAAEDKHSEQEPNWRLNSSKIQLLHAV